MAGSQFLVKIWGGRGSIPTPGSATSEYGGNSACVEIRCGNRVLVFDSGSGIRELGFDLNDRNVSNLDLLFGHFHYDHIVGFPFFMPLHNQNARIRIWSGNNKGSMTTYQVISDYMRPPFFPVGPDIFAANVEYNDFETGQSLDFGDGITVHTAHLTHPGGCTGYRVEFDGRSFAYVSDHEHIPGSDNEYVLRLINQADLVIYDAMYTEEELPEFTGYGHSTWQEGVRLCKMADAKKLVLFHHRPKRNDDQLREIEHNAQKAFPQTVAARDKQEFML